MLRRLASVVVAAGLLMPVGGIASAAPSRSIGTPNGWAEDFCKDRKNWPIVEDWTGETINTRAQCVAALKGLG